MTVEAKETKRCQKKMCTAPNWVAVLRHKYNKETGKLTYLLDLAKLQNFTQLSK